MFDEADIEAMLEWDFLGYYYDREGLRENLRENISCVGDESLECFLKLVCEIAKKLDDLKDDCSEELFADLKQQRSQFEQMKKSFPKHLEEDNVCKIVDELDGIFLAYPQFDKLYDRLVDERYEPVIDLEIELYGLRGIPDAYIVGGYLTNDEGEEEGEYYVCDACGTGGGPSFGSLDSLESFESGHVIVS